MGKVLLEEQSLIDIANSIRNKTGSNETMKPGEMATNIDSIEVGNNDDDYFIDNKIPTYMASYNSIGEWCTKIKKLPAFECNETNTSLSYMFSYFNGEEIDLSNFNTSNVKSMQYMFNHCINLKSLDLNTFSTSNVTKMGNMFNYCKSLTHLDIRNFDFTNVTSYSSMFGSGASSGPPNDCLIIVKDETTKTWITSKFSRLTNVKTVAEYESGV